MTQELAKRRLQKSMCHELTSVSTVRRGYGEECYKCWIRKGKVALQMPMDTSIYETNYKTFTKLLQNL